MSQTFATVATFDHYLKANFYKNTLESAGIACFLVDEFMGELSNAIGGIKLKVFSFDVEHAQKLIKKWENLPYYTPEGKILKCPECGSSRLKRDFKVIRGIKSFFKFIFAVLTSTYPLHSKNKSFCQDCEHIF